MAERASRLSCWVYFSTHYEGEELTFPCHEDYNSYGDHGLEYDIRYVSFTCTVYIRL